MGFHTGSVVHLLSGKKLVARKRRRTMSHNGAPGVDVKAKHSPLNLGLAPKGGGPHGGVVSVRKFPAGKAKPLPYGPYKPC